MRPITSYSPIFPIAVGLVAGIAAAWWIPVWVAVVPVMVAVALYLKSREWTAVGMFFVAVGMSVCFINMPRQAPVSVFSHKFHFSAVIKYVNETPNSYQLTVELDSVEHRHVRPFTTLLTVNSLDYDFIAGQRINFFSRLSPPDGAPKLPGDPDLTAFYKSSGIVATAFCQDGEVEITAAAPAFSRALDSARHKIASALVSSPLSADCSAFLLAALLGDDSMIPPATEQAFRSAGISHVLAISGLHVGIIVMIALMLTLPFSAFRWGFYIRPVIAALLIWLYAMLVGMPASVVRAAIMTSVFMLTRLIQNGHTGLNSLVISVTVILMVKPMWIYSPGFQLSVAAVASILAFTSLVPAGWQRYPVRYFLLMSLIVPIAAMLGTSPIAIMHYSTFPLLFLPANLAVGILVPWILGFGVVIAIFALCGWHLTIMASITNFLFRLLDLSADAISGFSWSEISGISLPWAFILPYFAGVVFLWIAIKWKSWRWGTSSLGCFGIMVMIPALGLQKEPVAELYVLPDIDATKVVAFTKGSRPLLLLPDAYTDTASVLAEANSAHRGYLRLRGAESFTPISSPGGVKIATTAIRFLRSDADTLPGTPDSAYLIVCKGFKGHLAPIVKNRPYKMIFFSPALNPKITRRLSIECADTIPHRDLRKGSESWLFF